MRSVGPEIHTHESLSVVIPCFNEGDNVWRVLEDLIRELDVQIPDYEIILVDDGSTDCNDSPPPDLASHSKIKWLRHLSRKGSGSARKTGMMAATGEWIAWMDADGTYLPGDLVTLWKIRQQDTHIIGMRRPESGWNNFPRRFAKGVFRMLVSILWMRKIPDLNSGLRLFPRKQALEWAHALPKGFSCATVATLASLNRGYPLLFVPIDYLPRSKSSKSKFRPIVDSARMLGQILLWRMRKRSSSKGR